MDTIVILKTKRTQYSASEASKGSISVREMIEELEHYPSDAKIVFCNDGGYTYGEITERTINEI